MLGFFSNFLLVQIVLESTALAVSQMTKPLKQGFMALALLGAFTYTAYALGSLLGGRWVDKLGIRTTYRGVLVIRTLIWTAMASFFDPEHNTVPLEAMIPLFSLDYFFHSISRVAENKLQVAWFQNAPVASGRFGSIREFMDYGIGFAMTALAGLAIWAYGFQVVVYSAPAIFGFAALWSFLLNKLPQVSPKKSKKVHYAVGLKAIFSNPGILKPLIGYALINAYIMLLYFMVTPAFGAFESGGERARSSLVSGSLTSLYGLGAIVGTALMAWIMNRIEKATEHLQEPIKTESHRALMAQSGSRVLKWAALGILGSWFFASHFELASLIWPIFSISPLLILIGLTGQLALVHMDTIWKDRIPKDKADEMGGSIVGAGRALSYAVIVVGLLFLGTLFHFFMGNAFLLFALCCTVTAGIYLWLSHAIRELK